MQVLKKRFQKHFLLAFAAGEITIFFTMAPRLWFRDENYHWLGHAALP
jgi:hypothetical protein